MVDHLKTIFPRLATATFRVTSPPDPVYNCIAWAAGDTADWRWPPDNREGHWPVLVPHALTLEAFAVAFVALVMKRALPSPRT